MVPMSGHSKRRPICILFSELLSDDPSYKFVLILQTWEVLLGLTELVRTWTWRHAWNNLLVNGIQR